MNTSHTQYITHTIHHTQNTSRNEYNENIKSEIFIFHIPIPILVASPPTASEGPAHDRQPPRKSMRFADVHAFHHPIHVGSAIKEPPTLE